MRYSILELFATVEAMTAVEPRKENNMSVLKIVAPSPGLSVATERANGHNTGPRKTMKNVMSAAMTITIINREDLFQRGSS
jgi:hypothetical protein